jgi:DNA-binding transcriptional MerR regulator
LTVNKLSQYIGVSAHAVRYYSRIGLLNPGRNPENGYRLFDRSDIKRLRFIRLAQGLGFTLDEVADILKIADEGRAPCCQVRGVMRQRIKENRSKIQELLMLQERMEKALFRWEAMPDQDSNEQSVCHLIETEEH